METLRSFARRRPLASYFVLAFALSWGGVLLVVGPGRIPGTDAEVERLFPFAYLAMLVGPSVAGLLLTWVVHGRAGLRKLGMRLSRWRVAWRWWAVGLFTAPVVTMVGLFVLAPLSPAFRPALFSTEAPLAVLLFGLWVGLGAGVFEELGWTGFAIPELRRRRGVLGTGLVLGLLWGAWHFLVNAWGNGRPSGAGALVVLVASVLVGALVNLTAFRVLMVWVYDRTESLLVAMIMHASLTASLLILGPPATGADALTWNLVSGALLWAVVGAVALANHGHLARPPLQQRPV